MVKSKIPSEIERLHKLGFAIHWLRPRSKVPVDSGWTRGPRADLDQLRARFRPNLNFGVRLGEASQVAGAYLAVIDVDVKSSEARHADEARARLFELYPEIENGPYLLSGRGNGSAHYYVRVKAPVKGAEVKARSVELVKVRMPSVAPSKREAEDLTDAEVAGGWRLRPAWEISLLCEGRQAALVGSIHPDTGEPYRWGKTVNGTGKDIPLIEAGGALSSATSVPAGPEDGRGRPPGPSLEFESVAAEDLPLTKEQRDALVNGAGVTDRSAKVFELCIVLAAAGVSDRKILSVFTDRAYYLGNCAFDHRKTGNRELAGRWVEKYCLAKAKAKVNDSPFDIEEVPTDAELNEKRRDRNEKRPKVEPARRIWPYGFDGSEDYLEDMEKLPPRGNRPAIIKPTFANVLLIFEKKVSPSLVRLEQFTGRVVWNAETPWGSAPGDARSAGFEDAITIKKWFADTFHVEPSNVTIDEALLFIARANAHHVVKDYLEALEWDGVERLSGALKTYLGAVMPEPYLSAVSRKFFLACVKRIYEPGCKFDHVVVLEGRQGVGKSTFAQILASEDWFLDGLPNFQDKDAALNLIGTWICELGELATLYRSANETAKAFITRRVDKVRPPYGHRRVEYPRATVFLGSTNEDDYFTDPTGNRRFWPVKVAKCQFAELTRDRDQMWAEALWRYYFAPEPLYLTGQAKHQAEIVQELRRLDDEGDAIGHILADWIKSQKPNRDGVIEIRMVELFRGPLIILPSTRANSNAAARVLRKMGFEKRHTEKGKAWRLKKNGSAMGQDG